MTTTIEKYRDTRPAAEAFQFRGEFPLEFLREGETVRSAGGPVVCQAVIAQGTDEITISRNDWVIRDYRSGAIQRLTDQAFRSRYELDLEVTAA